MIDVTTFPQTGTVLVAWHKDEVPVLNPHGFPWDSTPGQVLMRRTFTDRAEAIEWIDLHLGVQERRRAFRADASRRYRRRQHDAR